MTESRPAAPVGTLQLFRSVAAALATAGAIIVAAPTPGHAQAPPLGTAESFAILAGSTVTNTGPSVINGDVGVWPGNTAPGFPPGTVFGTIHLADGVAQQAQSDNTTAYNVLSGRPIMQNLSGQDLGGLQLIAGVYGYDAAAQLTGTLTLDGQGNPNSVFIINVGSALTTASSSNILLINGAQAGNVFFRVGSSATLGSDTDFAGYILALTSITLNTGADIACGAAWAQNGAVTLDTNVVSICIPEVVSPDTVLPSDASENERAVAAAIAAFIAGGGTLPPGFEDLLAFLSPSQLADAFSQLSGEVGTGSVQAGTQAMNSFLSLVTNPFPGGGRPFAQQPERSERPPMYVKGPTKAPPAGGGYDRRRWGIWAAGYGSQGYAAGDPMGSGSHDRSVTAVGYATGLDYRITPNTVAGFALAGGGTRFNVADGRGHGHSDMFQAAIYSLTQINAGYVSGALAYGGHRVHTDRTVVLFGTNRLTADYTAHGVGGRIEGGYRFAVPNFAGWPGRSGITPYAAVQGQMFHTPAYAESAGTGTSDFALSYDGRTTTMIRTEVGAWLDWSVPVKRDAVLSLRARAAWAHDHWSGQNMTAMFTALPGSSFEVIGATPASDLLLASGSAEIGFRNGFSVAMRFDGEFSEHSQKYSGIGRLRYQW